MLSSLRPQKYHTTSGLRLTDGESNLITTEMNRVRYRAQSLLTGLVFRDGSYICPPLTLDQATDVLKWSRNYMVT